MRTVLETAILQLNKDAAGSLLISGAIKKNLTIQ